MKLSLLYTEQHDFNEGFSDKIRGLLSRRQNPKTKRIRNAVEKAFDAVVRSSVVMKLDDKDRQDIQRRLTRYKQTLLQSPDMARDPDPDSLARDLMAKRAARYVRNYRDPKSAFKNLGLNPEWMSHSWA